MNIPKWPGESLNFQVKEQLLYLFVEVFLPLELRSRPAEAKDPEIKSKNCTDVSPAIPNPML